MDTDEPLIRVRRLTTRLKIGKGAFPAVEDLSFDIWPGRTLALVGESGCGKSMTALSIMRLLPSPPALFPEGEILYRGQNLLSFSEKQMRALRGYKIAMIFQDPQSSLNPVFRIGDQLAEVGRRHLALTDEEAYEKALRLLKEVGMQDAEEKIGAFPHQLSGGLKQRAMIAMALMGDPDLLIADEPTTALDVTVQAQVLDTLCRLQESRGMAILLITHDMGVVAEMADEVAVMYAAKCIESGPVQDIFNRMAHPYTQGLFASRPQADIKKLQPIQGSVPPLQSLPQGCRFHPRCLHKMAQCAEGPVPIVSMQAAGHAVHCWLYQSGETHS